MFVPSSIRFTSRQLEEQTVQAGWEEAARCLAAGDRAPGSDDVQHLARAAAECNRGCGCRCGWSIDDGGRRNRGVAVERDHL